MSDFIANFANIEVLTLVWPQLYSGLLMTLVLSFSIVPTGLAVGLIIAIVYSFRIRIINILLVFYTDFFRAFPPLVLLMFVYYGFPFIGIETTAFQAVVLALTLNTSSYFSEVFRAGIEGVPRGQVEAARSTGMSALQTLRDVVLPQAVRSMSPDLVSNVLETIKLTALASVVTLPELLRMARLAQGNTFNATPLMAAAIIYLLMLWPLVRIISRLERRVLRAG